MNLPPAPARAVAIMRQMSLVFSFASMASISISIPLFLAHTPFPVGVAWQFASWGVIDLIFAAFGSLQAAKLAKQSPGVQAAAAKKLERTLVFNFKLNYLWTGGSLAVLLAAWPLQSASLAGHGLGASLQALLLFVFDRVYVARLRAAGAGVIAP
jgi:hypothetical protein